MADIVLVGPTHERLRVELQRLADAADHRQRARTLGLDAAMSLARLPMRADRCVRRWGGEGVCNAYKDRAETSVAGLAWFRAPGGKKHVRVYAGRVAAPKSSGGERRAEAFRGLEHDSPLIDFVGTVYPAIRLPETLLKKHETGRKADRWPALKVALCRSIMAETFEPAGWAALADWYGEQPEVPYPFHSRCAEQCRTALAALRLLLEGTA